MRTIYVWSLILACLITSLNALAQKPQLVEDIWPGVMGSYPRSLTPWGEWLLFAAGDSLHGEELWRWKQMGMPAERVTDNGSIQLSGCVNLLDNASTMPMPEYNGSVYFSTNTDLTEQRCLKYKGVVPLDTIGDSSQSFFALMELGNKLLLINNKRSDSIWGIWSYDDVHPPVEIFNFMKSGFKNGLGVWPYAAYKGKLYFGADSIGFGTELWSLDPATQSVSLVSDIWPGFRPSSPSDMVLAGSKLYFKAIDSAHGCELYSFDGTAVRRLTDLMPGPDYGLAPNSVRTIAFFNGGIFFIGLTSRTHGALFRYDTASGMTAKVYDLLPNGNGYSNLFPTPNNLYFLASSSSIPNTGTGLELYKYDGTNGSLVADLNPGPGSGASPQSNMALFGGYVYFLGNNGSTGWELYRVKDSARGVGVPELVGNPELRIGLFPNPAPGGRFNISLDARQPMKEVSVRITDVTGRELQSRQFSNPGKSFFEEMNLSGTAPGMYFVRITADGETFSRRVSVAE